ncbi:hypothetical protein NQ315_002542 [Exocentrus adspersus]|uniref:Uncharacterized protein n=1 Tax=Exocentrus adspersus TaxID=1586481 RepID=A0AAV8VFM2_9CUCU|nr:hypothetical protein NQ315_002542 [Exocentrus adspersus]
MARKIPKWRVKTFTPYKSADVDWMGYFRLFFNINRVSSIICTIHYLHHIADTVRMTGKVMTDVRGGGLRRKPPHPALPITRTPLVLILETPNQPFHVTMYRVVQIVAKAVRYFFAILIVAQRENVKNCREEKTFIMLLWSRSSQAISSPRTRSMLVQEFGDALKSLVRQEEVCWSPKTYGSSREQEG